MDLIKEQMILCNRLNAPFIGSPGHLKVGISLNLKDGTYPINGLRHPIEGDTTGWYIWAGEQFSNDPDFFVPLRVAHLKEWRPEVLKYLGLAPGWRFLIGPYGYEDIWEDKSLLDI
ncbi:MAG TPA: hypothetical protein VK543_06355 [Puia sp.]|nr:hypothetical protein [Puia sp.]